MPEASTFRIRFEKQNRITFSDGRHEMTIRRRRDPVRDETVLRLSRGLSDQTLVDPVTLRLLGLNLYELLFFNAHANEWFESVCERSTRTRLVLEFTSYAESVIGYPWEFLYVPPGRWRKGGKYLIDQTLSLVRRLVRKTDPLPQLERLRFLVVDCLPASANGAQASALVSEAGKKLGAPPSTEIDLLMQYLEGWGETKCLRFPRQMELSQAMADFKPDVVHLNGHGRFGARDGVGFEFCLCPRDAGSGIDLWETDERIAEAISAHVPSLVVLQTCKGGKTERYEGYEGAPITLLQHGVPNVVALQHEIPRRDASGFVTSLYEALAGSSPLEDAVREGRQRLHASTYSLVTAFGLPVTYMQHAEFTMPHRQSRPNDAAAGGSEQVATDERTASPAETSPAAVGASISTAISSPSELIESSERRPPRTTEPRPRETTSSPLTVRL